MTLDAERYRALAGFRLALRRFLAASETISRHAGITTQQYQAMLAIRTRDGVAMSIKDLAEQLLLTHHAVVQMVDRMARAGLAGRNPSLEDRRSVLVGLTPKGASLLDELAAKHLEEIQRQEPVLSESLRLLRRMRRAD